MEELKGFSKGVADHLGYYVYRLIDPRNGHTFYVGKGKGDRVFNHINASLKESDLSTSEKKEYKEQGISLEKALEDKNKRILNILKSGEKVIHIIQRHGIEDEKTALIVEAALMECFLNLTNKQGGYKNHDYGVANAVALNKKYSKEPLDESKILDINFMIIKVKADSIDLYGNRYEATRKWWKSSKSRADKVDYVLSVTNGIIKEVYKPSSWTKNEKISRIAFEGDTACEEVRKIFVNKLLPKEYMVQGASNPIMYKKG